MNKPKVSKDYIQLRKRIGSDHTPTEVKVTLGEAEKATITLVPEKGKTIIFESSADDVILFCFSLKSLFDQRGNSLIGEVRDLNKFYDDVQTFIDLDNKKLHAARDEIVQGKVDIKYVPHLLLRQFLEEGSHRNHKPYLKLKEDYFCIKILQVEEMKMVYDGMLRIRKQQSLKTRIFDTTLDLFKYAFHKEPIFLKNYQLFQKFNKADVMDILISTGKDKDVTDNLFDMLHKRGGVPAEEGLSHVLSSYAGMAETINKLLNIIRGAIEIIEGISNPDANKGSEENWLIVKNNPKYSIIVEDFDPRIRHGKAHNNFTIDTEKEVVNFYKEGRIRELSVSYTFEQIRVMWHRIHVILSALIIAVCLEQSTLTGVILNSPEYKLSLLRLGNFKTIK